MTKDDVQLRPIAPPSCDAGCPYPAVTTIALQVGADPVTVGSYCEPCAEAKAARLREALPPAKETT